MPVLRREAMMKELTIIRSGSMHEAPKERICVCHITSRCNLGCSYCISHSILNTVQWSREVFFRNLDWIKSDGRTTSLMFFGGEPFIHPDLLDAVAKCKAEMSCRLSAMSNIVVPLNYLQRLYDIDPDFLTMVSVHFEKINIPKFLEKAAFLASRNKPTKFKLMLHPQFRAEAHTVYDELLKLTPSSNINCSMIRFPEDKYDHFASTYNQEDWDFMNRINADEPRKDCFVEFCDADGKTYIVNDKYESILEKGLLHFGDMLCTVDAYKCIIDTTGNARMHVCRRQPKTFGEPLYTDTPVPCRRKNCYCGGHVEMPKFRAPMVDFEHAGTPSPASLSLSLDSIYVENQDGKYTYFLKEE